MPPIIYLLTLGCAICVAFALMPEATPQFAKLTLPEGVERRRRTPLAAGFVFLGKTLLRSARRQEALKEQLLYGGSSVTAEEFIGIKTVSTVAAAVAGLILAREAAPAYAVWGLLIGACLGLLAPDVWLRARITRRHDAMLRLLPEVIDLLTLCVGAGLDFLGALNKVVILKVFRKKREPLIDELSLVLQEIKLGKRRFEALKAMARRVNLSELSSFVRTLVLADRMGTPIAEVLAIHSEDVRFERFMRAERMALKAPIKILFPLIFFIMPCVALIVGGPIMIQFMHQNPFAK